MAAATTLRSRKKCGWQMAVAQFDAEQEEALEAKALYDEAKIIYSEVIPACNQTHTVDLNSHESYRPVSSSSIAAVARLPQYASALACSS